ncbi:MAG: adenylate/guanylate cyclase domain-containing protein [Deltaproteobacteria bacterium]|nr:adenylate/guanylate cyclase domain-containing protein [Deltaproteobacteria bacterium]
MKIGIKIKLALILSVPLFLTTSLMGVILIAHQRASLDAQMRSMAGTITAQFADNSKIPLMQKDGLAMNLLIQAVLKYPGINDAYILNDNLVIEGHKDLIAVGHEYLSDQKITGLQGPPPWLVKESDGVLTFVFPIIFKQTTVGYAVVLFSNTFIRDRVYFAITSVVIIAAIAVILVPFLSIPLAAGLVRPIFRLFKGTNEIAMGNFDYRIPEKGKDEMGDLVRSFNRMASELKKKEILKGVFNRYVSRHVADEILKDPERIRLGGERRNVTVFFADIRGFTSLSRSMMPEQTVEILNRYFTMITEIIFRFEGTVDKFIGDAVMCVFGSPIKSDKHIEEGIKAAVAIKMAMAGVNKFKRPRVIPLQMGIGIDSGEVIVGNMGSQVRMEFTAMGDAVNMASRLTDMANGGDILISETVYNSIKDNIVAERIPWTSIKGIDQPLTLYNLVGLKGAWKEEVEGIVREVLMEFEHEGVIVI